MDRHGVGLALALLLGCTTGRVLLAQEATIPIHERVQPATIDSIVLRRTVGGWGMGPAYEFVLRRDGTAKYRGDRNVPVLGSYSASLDTGAFRRLAALVVRNDFFEYFDRYDAEVTDQARRYLTVFVGSRHKTIESYGLGGPPLFQELVIAVDSVGARLQWVPNQR